MKKIINGKRYDTEKSTIVGEYSFSSFGDFNYISEGLYVTPRSKSYFLAGEGGANTRYRQTVSQNTWAGGEIIQPMSKEDAFAWAQEYLSADEVEAFFSDMIEEA